MASLFALTMLGTSACFGAESYPNRPVRVVVPVSPGGGTDFTARIISQQLSEQLGRPFVVENRTGASGTIANALVAKSTPDGYTIMMMGSDTVIVPGLFRSLPFDVATDFSPVTQILAAPNVLAVHPSVKAATLNELIALAQANPGKLNYGSAGPGSVIHLIAELFKLAAKVNLAHIPYKGGGEAIAAVIGGQVDLLFAAMPTALAHVNGGKVRALAVTTDGKRSPVMPDVPTMREAGVSGMGVPQWWGLVGPAGMPKEIVATLYSEITKAVAVPAVRERFTVQGTEIVGSNPEDFSRHIRNELRLWAGVIKSAGITPN